MAQVRSFNPKNAGTTKYECLANTRKGYGIAPKYANAWQAWLNTQQHTDALPSGVAVPVFWELWLTLDGVYKNYGHIAVSLPDGRIWTDGRYYANIDTLNRYYLGGKGRYVGWGESVNDVKVVEGGDEVFTQEMYNAIKPMFTDFEVTPPPDGLVVGTPVEAALKQLTNTPEWGIAVGRAKVSKSLLDKYNNQVYGDYPKPPDGVLLNTFWYKAIPQTDVVPEYKALPPRGGGNFKKYSGQQLFVEEG